MTIAFVVQRVAGTATAWTSLNVGPGTASTIALRNTLIMTLVVDNAGASGAAPVMTVTDPRGNYWQLISSRHRDPGAASEGVAIYIWKTYVSYAYQNGDNIVINSDVSIPRGAVRVTEFSGVSPKSYSVVTAVTGSGNSTAATAGDITPTATGQLVFALTGVETNVSLTGDADGAGGSWSTLFQQTSDSGVAATSIRHGEQYKIVTNFTSIQNNTMTWAGAADWASLAVIFDVAPASVLLDNVPGNPNYSCLLGPEILPVGSQLVAIDTGTAHGIGFDITPNTAVGTSSFTVAASFEDPNIRQQHTLIYELWDPEQFVASFEDEITTIRLPLRTVTLDANASVIGGGTALDALNSIGGSYVTIDGSVTNNSQTLRFSTTPLDDYVGTSRIVRIGVQYLGWKDDGSPAFPGEGINVRWDDTLAPDVQSSNPGFWLTPDYRRNAQVITKWFGEINAIPRGTIDNNNVALSATTHRAPWTITDLKHMDSGDETASVVIRGLQGYDLLQTDISLDFIEMIVEVVPERRQAVIARRVQNLDPGVAGYEATTTSRMLDALNTGTTKALNDSTYLLTVREALPASSSDQLRADPTSGTSTRYSTFEAIGPSLLMKAVKQPRPTLDSTQRLTRFNIGNGVAVSTAGIVFDYVLSMVGFSADSVGVDGAMWVGYEGLSTPTWTMVHATGPKTQTSYVVGPGGVTYERIKVLVKPDPTTTDDLVISVQQPLATPLATATITVAAAEASPDRGDGWFEVNVALSVPITPASGAVVLVFSSTTPSTSPWQVASARPTGSNYVYGYLPAVLPSADPLGAARPNDIAAVLCCELDEPDVTMDFSTYTFPNHAYHCYAETVRVPEITITNIADYDYVLIEREAENSGVWEPVILLSGDTLVSPFYDPSAPWDVDLVYRVTGFRASDHWSVVSPEAPWSDGPITAPGATFGLADVTSTELFLYTPTSSGELELQWTDLLPVENVFQHNQDYSLALRPTENRGMALSTTVDAGKFATCNPASLAAGTAELPPGNGQRGMTPLPFSELRDLQFRTRLGLCLPGGHVRWVSLSLGALMSVPAVGMYTAEITLQDVQKPEDNPWPEDE